MSERVHYLRSAEGRADFEVTAFDGGELGPCLQFTITNLQGWDVGAATFTSATYAQVELLHDALGAWLLDRLLSGAGRVKRAGEVYLGYCPRCGRDIPATFCDHCQSEVGK